MKLIAIDPGSEYCGITKILVDDKYNIQMIEPITIKTNSIELEEADIRSKIHGKRYGRLAKLEYLFEEIVRSFSPNVIVCEMAFYHKLHPTAYGPLVETIFVLRNISMTINPSIPFIGYAPRMIKKMFTGKSNACKEEVREAVISNSELINLISDNIHKLSEHAIDSIAVGVAHLKVLKGELS